jgi:drug/metabolite transporter (DMT)-like permease
LVIVETNPFSVTWVSVFVAMVFLNFYTFVIKREKITKEISEMLSLKGWLLLILIGILNYSVYRFSRIFALERLPVITVSFLGEFVGFVTMGMSIIVLKEKPSWSQLFGGIIAVLGALLYFERIPTDYQLEGILLVVVGMVAIGLTNNLARKIAVDTKHRVSNTLITTIALSIGGLVTLMIGLIFDYPPKIYGLNNWFIIFYTGFVQIALALTLWNYVLRYLRSYQASLLGLTSIIWVSIFAFIVLGETVTVQKVFAMVLVSIGVFIVQMRKDDLNQFWQKVHIRFM